MHWVHSAEWHNQSCAPQATDASNREGPIQGRKASLIEMMGFEFELYRFVGTSEQRWRDGETQGLSSGGSVALMPFPGELTHDSVSNGDQLRMPDPDGSVIGLSASSPYLRHAADTLITPVFSNWPPKLAVDAQIALQCCSLGSRINGRVVRQNKRNPLLARLRILQHGPACLLSPLLGQSRNRERLI
jgi:hypothetical protein